ncbi:nucleoside-diphosphate-sugar epimerase [Polaribacter sp. Hel1_33_96]|jgi:nucleoside-diphosphate-sugar epimerase|uniref:NAD-dependent epimerase/dehydratase family protein n=1 Tax=Polaribacter sp. Hel1_33_96 TaxID=1336805 RepID=UPI000C7056CE|nr:NAD(P)-dependent oxidoreductase [Polaribacter sp. Hel1_33_96]PKV65421.1 nucleoside-diphosphate-sugar epimerase [Polaribacter sp. Hel1_33_96]
MCKRILITGSTGFVGKHLIPKLIENEYDILEITRSISKSDDFFGNKTQKIEVNDANFNQKIKFFKPEIVIHLASYLTSSDEWTDVEKLVDTNILFLSKILDAVKTNELKLFVNTGTFAEYFKGDGELLPAYFYAATKTASRAIVDYYANAYDFKQTTVVPYTIYGGVDTQKKIIDLIFDSTNSKEPLQLSLGEQVLDFIHIDDVVNFYLSLIDNINILPNTSEFKLGTGIGTNLKELAKIVEEVSGEKTNINWGGKPYRKSDVMYAVADQRQNKNILGWFNKINIEQGVKIKINDK